MTLTRTEFSVIGCVLRHRKLIPVLKTLLPHAEAFEETTMRGLWLALEEIAFVGGGIDAISPATVAAAVKTQDNLKLFDLDKTGGSEREVYSAYFEAEAMDPPLPPEGLEPACAVIQRRWLASRLNGTCLDYIAKLKRPDADPESLVPQLQGDLNDILRNALRVDDRIMTLDQAVIKRLDTLDLVRKTKNPMIGLPTGYGTLDKQIGGFMPGTMTILGGWFKDGKSSMACKMGLNGALALNMPVALFSYEMGAVMIADRFFSQWFGVNPNALRWGTADEVGGVSYETWSQALRQPGACKLPQKYLDRMNNFHIIESTGMTVQEIEGGVRNLNYRLTQQGRPEIALVIVDYLQLVTPRRGNSQDSTADRVSAVGWDLAMMSRPSRLNVPVLALSQLTQEGHTWSSKALEGHCDSFWVIRRKVPGLDTGMLHLVLNRSAPSGVAYAMEWDTKTLSYYMRDEIHNPETVLAEAKKQRQQDDNDDWRRQERKGDRRDGNGRGNWQRVEPPDSHKSVFGEDP